MDLAPNMKSYCAATAYWKLQFFWCQL